MTPVAFVTGASSGLGEGLAVALAREGWSVGLAARREEKLEAVAERIRSAGGTASVHVCDVTERKQVHGAIAACEAVLGPVDLLIANAGVSEMTSAQRFDALQFERVVRINLLGAVYAVEAVLPGMLERGSGHLVAMGSLAGYNGLPKSAAYSATKAALHNLFESLSLDLRGTGVDVTMLTPGFIETPLTDRNLHPMPFLMDLDDGVEAMMGAIRARKPLAAFPFPLSTVVRLAQLMPAGVYRALASRIKREKRES